MNPFKTVRNYPSHTTHIYHLKLMKAIIMTKYKDLYFNAKTNKKCVAGVLYILNCYS